MLTHIQASHIHADTHTDKHLTFMLTHTQTSISHSCWHTYVHLFLHPSLKKFIGTYKYGHVQLYTDTQTKINSV